MNHAKEPLLAEAVQNLYEAGIVKKELRNFMYKSLKAMSLRLGKKAVLYGVERTIGASMNKTIGNPIRFIEKIAEEYEPDEEEEPKTIEEEIVQERIDMRNAIELKELIAAFHETTPPPFTEPDDPHFDKHPSIFDGPLAGHEEYKHNTYISVYREAKAENTSMHEICRRKKLDYGMLIQ